MFAGILSVNIVNYHLPKTLAKKEPGNECGMPKLKYLRKGGGREWIVACFTKSQVGSIIVISTACILVGKEAIPKIACREFEPHRAGIHILEKEHEKR